MAVRLRVREVAEGRGFKNARELADAAGIAYPTAYAYWDDTNENVSKKVMAKLCMALGVHVYALVDDDLTFTPERRVQTRMRTSPAPRRRKSKIALE